MKNVFKKAMPIYPKKYEKEMNVSFVFTNEIEIKNKAFLYISGHYAYQIFDNKKFVCYGPARAAHKHYRVDKIKLKKGKHNLEIIVAGYNCISFEYTNDLPFLIAEIEEDNQIITYTGDDKFKCFLYDCRYQKVSRFSYQRPFSESYIFNDLVNKQEVKADVVSTKKFIKRKVDYPKYRKEAFKLIESGTFKYNDQKNVYDDRYMHIESLKIFNKDTWEVNPNDYISKLEYERKEIKCLKEGSFETYSIENSKTGFIEIDIKATKDSKFYLVYDEVDNQERKDIINISFSRNTTQNIISYDILKGSFKHISFEPYTVKYLRVIVEKGQIRVNKINLVKYENDSVKVSFNFENDKIQKVIDAAISTFRQNSVDILTDCPSRERAGWLLDSNFTSMAEFALTGKNQVEYNFLENYAMSPQLKELPKHMIPMCYPSDTPEGEFIPNWSMWYVIELNNYYNRTHDKKLINKSKKKVLGLLEYFKQFENKDGLLEDLKGWIFVEWSMANSEEFIKGVNIPSNITYEQVLEIAGKLYNDEELVNKAMRLKAKILEIGYNGEFFVDNLVRINGKLTQTDHTSEVCQYYAFYFDIATKESHNKLFNTMVNEFGPNRDYEHVYPKVYKANVIIGDYLRLFIMLKYGLIEKVRDESIDFFYNMAIRTGTLWEHDSCFASLNHGLTSSIVPIINSIYFGLDGIDHKSKTIYLNKNHLNENASYEFDNKIVIKNENGNIKTMIPSNYRIEYR